MTSLTWYQWWSRTCLRDNFDLGGPVYDVWWCRRLLASSSSSSVSVCQCFNHAAGRQPARVQYSGIYSPSSLADVIVIAPPRGVDRDLRAKLRRSHDKLIPDAFIRPTQRDAGRKLASDLCLPSVQSWCQPQSSVLISWYDEWFVQVKECGGDGGRSILLCRKGYRQHPQRGEQISVANVMWKFALEHELDC